MCPEILLGLSSTPVLSLTFQLELVDLKLDTIENPRIVKDGSVSPLSHILQNGPNSFFEAKALLANPSFDFEKGIGQILFLRFEEISI